MASDVDGLIEAVRVGDTAVLDLSGQDLAEVPAAVRTLTALTALHLDGNRLCQLPEWLGELSRLTTLTVNWNHLTRLSASLGRLTALEVLDIAGNHLTELPESLAGLTALTRLTLGANPFARLPRWLADLRLSECDFDRSDIDVSEVSDVWFRSARSLEEIASGLGTQGGERDEENYWEWIIAAFAGVHIDITRPRPHITGPGTTDTRIFRWGGAARLFPEHTVRELVAGLRRIGVGPVYAGRWTYRGGDDFDKEIDENVIPVSYGETMDWKIELIPVPVTDVDRAKAFYQKIGFNADHDQRVHEGLRFVQLTPPGSACSIVIGDGITDKTPGTQEIQVVVANAETARTQLLEAGVEASNVDVQPWGNFVFFRDPDGNKWSLQAIARRPNG